MVMPEPADPEKKPQLAIKTVMVTPAGATGVVPTPASLPPDVEKALQDPAKRFGKYVLVRLLGKGGMGEVFLAWDSSLARHVALKFLSGQAVLEKARFLREAQLAARLKHPHIVSVYEAGEIEGRAYIALEYVQGRTLDACDLPLEKSLSVMADAAEAVHHAHEQGVIHRDLKPQNLMLDAKGRVYVMDFGLALQVEAPSGMSLSGAILGTPAFMSPEQARGEREKVDRRSDVYSLGTTLYALLTGRPPASGKAVLDVIQKVAEGRIEAPRKKKPSIPAEVETLVLKAMELEPPRRYATALEMAQDLRRYLQGEAIEARPASTVYRARKKLLKHRWVALASAAAILLATAFGGYVLVQRRIEDRQRVEYKAKAEEAETQGRLEDALQCYAKLQTLDPQDKTLEVKRKGIETRLDEDRKRMEADKQRAVDRQKAGEVYNRLGRELGELRMGTYRKGFRLGEAEFRQYETIRETCRAEMQRSGESAEGWWVVARCTEELGNVTDALEAYDKGLAVDPAHGMCLLGGAHLLLDRSWTIQGSNADLNQALALLERGVQAEVLSAIDLDLARGYAMALRKAADAAPYCDEMLKKWAGKAFAEEFHLIKGYACRERAGLVQAATVALEVRPSFYKAICDRGLAKAGSGDPAGGVADLDRALEIHPRYVLALLSRAQTQKGQGNLKAALMDYEQALRLDPRCSSAYCGRGNVKQDLRDFEGAIADYDETIRLQPNYAMARSNRALAKEASGDLRGALSDYDEALRSGSKSAALCLNRANLRKDLGDFKGALADYDDVIRMAPESSPAYVNRGLAKVGLGDFKAAIADYDKAIRLEPAHPYAYCNRGTARQTLGDLQGALKDFNEGIRLAPQDPMAHFCRGKIRQAQEDLKGALTDYDEAVRLAPQSARYLVDRGSARHVLGDLKGALADYDEVIRLDPSCASAYANRALVKILLAESEPSRAVTLLRAAVEDLEMALHLQPSDWPQRKQAQETLEQLRLRLGQPNK